MRKDFVEYLPYIIVSILVVSGIVIYKRGDFNDEKPPILINTSPSPTNSPATTEPNSTIITPSPTPEPEVIIDPANFIKPSIRPNRFEDDD